MKTLSLPLVAAAMLLAAPTLCCAASATTPPTKVQESTTYTEKAEKKSSAINNTASDKTEKQSPKKDLDDDNDNDDDDDDDSDDDERDDDKNLTKDENDDEDFDDEEDFDEEAVSAPYPFGELKLEEVKTPSTEMPAGTTTKGAPVATPATTPAKADKAEAGNATKPAETAKPVAKTPALWKAELPAKGFTIRSEWEEKPEFQNAARPDGKPQGAATLAMQQISDQEQQPFSLYVLMYIYDPETVGVAMTSPEKVIEQLITAPAEEAKQYGFVSTISDLPSTKTDDKRLMQELGVLQDVRKKVSIGQQDKTLYSQFYRLFIGKDFVVLGLVLGGEEGLEKKAQSFFDHISLVPSKTPANANANSNANATGTTPVTPANAAPTTPTKTPTTIPHKTNNP